jgi:hypothetical protein
MTLRDALRMKIFKLRLPSWNPTKYVEIQDSMFAAHYEQRATLYDHGSSMPIRLWELAQHNEWEKAE